MEIVTAADVIQLANTISVKCDLNIVIEDITQCTTDYLLALYHAIMGELPVGILEDCTSLDAQHHNVKCVIDTLSDDYLHVDLAHISAKSYICFEPTTMYNLLEILDGLLEFMLEHLSTSNADSGDEGDVDSDQMSDRHKFGFCSTIRKEGFASDQNESTCTEDLIGIDNEEIEEFVPLPHSRSADTSPSRGERTLSEHSFEETDKNDDTLTDFTFERTVPLSATDNTLPEPTTKTLPLSANVGSDEYPEPNLMSVPFSATESADTFPKQTLYDSLRSSINQSRDHSDPTVPDDPLISDLKTTYRVADKSPPLPQVDLDSEQKFSGISLSDISSSNLDSVKTPSVDVEPVRLRAEPEKETATTLKSEGVDETDGIPRPNIDQSATDSDSTLQSDLQLDNFEERPRREVKDWEKLLNNLQQTVDESKRIREQYFTSSQENSKNIGVTEDESIGSTMQSTDGDTTAPPSKRRQRNVRFEDTVSTKTAKELKEFKQVLQQERQLQTLKNKVLSNSYRDHLEEVGESERRKVAPLRRRVEQSEREMKQKKPVGKRRKSGLAQAARWKSWQGPVVHYKPRSGPVKQKIRGNTEIGEHDLLPLLIQEFPGLELSSTAVNNAWKKQFRQIEILTSNAANHRRLKRSSDKQLQESHNKHQLLTEIMRQEHEHTHRVREARERERSKKEANKVYRDKKQQSARVRRYYRDYQLQMRSRMLKRRTREENLFKNLFEEGLNIQKSRLQELRRYARDKRVEQQTRQRNEIASLENYYKDQFSILAETLETEKNDLNIRDKAQTKLMRKMRTGLRKKMEEEVGKLQEQICRDDDDVYFREVEADRIRRQLQLATYHSKFNNSIPT